MNVSTQPLKYACIIVAAGSGTRLGPGIAKQYMRIGNKTLLGHAISGFSKLDNISDLMIVHRAGEEDFCREIAAQEHSQPNLAIHFSAGGASRGKSVYNGLLGLGHLPNDTIILVHDAARAGIGIGNLGQILCHSVEELFKTGQFDAATPMLEVADALWRVQNGQLTAPVDKSELKRAQTPQAARLGHLKAAYERGFAQGVEFSDDGAAMRASGHKVGAILGDAILEKITYAGDIERLAPLFEKDATLPQTTPMVPVCATGFDAHRLVAGKGMKLCGVWVDFDKGLSGHSDADVALHALTDALFGTIGAGDIGKAFPPSDGKWKGADSVIFLKEAMAQVAAKGGQIIHVDVTIICEAPKIGPHREKMVANLADILGLDPSFVSVKATTTEAMGFTGRREGIAAIANATVLRPILVKSAQNG